MIFGVMLKPNHNASSGAMTTTGIVCEPTSSGYTALRTGPNASMTSAIATPTTMLTNSPISVSCSVTQAWCESTSRLLQNPSAILEGEGSVTRFTPETSTYTCHATMSSASTIA